MPGTLFVVATPIGNLADLSPRAIDILGSVALIACEDTRTSRTLLAHFGISTRSVSLHAHNERSASVHLVETLRCGSDVALISDAGTPAVSDPGARLVEEAHRSGIRVIPVPGPSAALAAFSASGFAADRLLFAGFLPASTAARRKAIAGLESGCAIILYEAPHRIRATLADLAAAFGAAREVAIGRELTKKFEEMARMPLGTALTWLDARAHREQGEFALVIAPEAARRERGALDADLVLATLLEALGPSDAAKLAAKLTGQTRKALYARALELGMRGKR
ncbi:MAG: 16S rRNA (cytidine(1402)-2'-O)-methyltransferase [Betaproteobacteria bacterium]|nr:16S rRNA (cytidine(1402)-2'-O)-methyltransferase [Betaproteobacteria bacterium]